MPRLAWIVVGVVLAGVWLWVVTSLPSPAANAPAAPEPAQGAAKPIDAAHRPRPPSPSQPAEPAAPQVPEQPAAPAPAEPSTPARPEHTRPRDQSAHSNQQPTPEKSGPIEELQKRFASEPRHSAAVKVELSIQEQFKQADTPAGLLKSVQCRTSVCRIELRWTPERAQGYMGGLMRSYLALDMKSLASLPSDELDADGSRPVEVYFARPDSIVSGTE